MPRERITDDFCTELGAGEGNEQEVIDIIIMVVIDAVVNLWPEERKDMNLKNMLSVRMTLDESLGYLGGQRLAHERAYLLGPALNEFASLSWFAMRRMRLDRTEYEQGFRAGFQDELDGTAHPLPSEQTVVLAY